MTTHTPNHSGLYYGSLNQITPCHMVNAITAT